MFQRCVLHIFFYGITFFPLIIHAQHTAEEANNKKENLSHQHLFDSDDILHFKLVGKLNKLFNDRGDDNSYHPMLLQYNQKDSNIVSLQLVVKTRGHFRRIKSNCKMPPLLLEFSKEEKNRKTIFKKEHKLKLVVPCQGDDFVIREWLVYKIYNLIAEKSFRAKLVLVDFDDSLKQRKTETHYCILIEDEKKVAERNNAYVWKSKLFPMQNTDKEEFKKMAVFEYMIGNTDWSIPFLQNIVLLRTDSVNAPFAVPYDFDHAGIVDAPYAGAAPELGISSVRERLYRGYCETDKKNFAETFKVFINAKDEIYNLYKNCPLLSKTYLKFICRYLDDFYKTISNNRIVETEFGKPCREDIHVELRGLKK